MSVFSESGSVDAPLTTIEWAGHGDTGTAVGPAYRHHDNGGWCIFRDASGWSYLPDHMIVTIERKP